jgi:hypothetical protein
MPKARKLTTAEVVNLIDCAGSGIGYWAASGHVDEAAKTYRVIERSDELPDGDAPTDKTLTFDEISTAFVALAAADKLPDWQMREIAEDDLGFDATVGDLVVQWAMFGEIVFG